MALMLLAQQGFPAEVRDRFPAGHGVYQLLVKNQIDRRDRRPNFVLSVVCSALIVGVWVVLAWCRKSYLGPAKIMYMCDGPIETVECVWVNNWCMLDWISPQNCRNKLLLHTADQLGSPTIGVFLFSCISLYVSKKSTFAFTFAVNIIKHPPLHPWKKKKRKKEKGKFLVTKRFHSLAYNRIC